MSVGGQDGFDLGKSVFLKELKGDVGNGLVAYLEIAEIEKDEADS